MRPPSAALPIGEQRVGRKALNAADDLEQANSSVSPGQELRGYVKPV
jgi:hypothetical protein